LRSKGKVKKGDQHEVNIESRQGSINSATFAWYLVEDSQRANTSKRTAKGGHGLESKLTVKPISPVGGRKPRTSWGGRQAGLSVEEIARRAWRELGESGVVIVLNKSVIALELGGREGVRKTGFNLCSIMIIGGHGRMMGMEMMMMMMMMMRMVVVPLIVIIGEVGVVRTGGQRVE
jgi:hypothetical protein